MGVMAEPGDLNRLHHPRKRMSYLGLTPGEYSSGGPSKKGSMTKGGNGRGRRVWMEGAHSGRYMAHTSTEMQKRQEGLPKEILDQAWQAQRRVCQRYQRLRHRGTHRRVFVTAIARERVAYIGSISRDVVLQPINPKDRLSRVPASMKGFEWMGWIRPRVGGDHRRR